MSSLRRPDAQDRAPHALPSVLLVGAAFRPPGPPIGARAFRVLRAAPVRPAPRLTPFVVGLGWGLRGRPGGCPSLASPGISVTGQLSAQSLLQMGKLRPRDRKGQWQYRGVAWGALDFHLQPFLQVKVKSK